MIGELIHPTAERVAAAGLLRGDELSFQLAAQLEAREFSSPQLQVIVEATQRVLRGIEPVDTQSVMAMCGEVLKERKDYVAVTEDFVRGLMLEDSSRAEPYSHTVKRMAYFRAVAEFSQWSLQELTSMPDEAILFAEMQERMQFLRPIANVQRVVNGLDTLDYVRVLKERQAERAAGTAKIFPWPWWSWRHIAHLGGGMVGLLTGAQGSGKSAYLEQMAEHWARTGKVVFVHLENNMHYTKDRRMARHTGIDITRLETKELNREEQQLVRTAEDEIAGWAENINYLWAGPTRSNPRGLTMEEITRELAALCDAGECDVVLLDYLNKVPHSRGQLKMMRESWDRTADTLDIFKGFCEEANIPGMTASQMTKEGKKTSGRLDSTAARGSGEIADKVQCMIITQREVLENDLRDRQGNLIAKKGSKSPLVNLYVEKQNRGADGYVFQQKYIGAEFRHEDPPGV